jgi:hypothetical protein
LASTVRLKRRFPFNHEEQETDDVVQSIRQCDRAATGFLLWYYEWVFHSEDRRYEPRPLIEVLGGDWSRLSRYYPKD